MSVWHDDDAFWETFGPWMFGPENLARAEAQVGAIVALMGLGAGCRLLDLCCGVGRHAIELARRGCVVTGVDRTTAYLDQARARARAAGIEVEIVRSDMRTFVRREAFDAAVNLYTSFGYFDDPLDDLTVAQNVAASVRPGGRALFEMNGKEIIARTFRERDWWWLADGTMMHEERKVESGWERIESRWILTGPGVYKEHTIRVRAYSGAELAALLRQAGFSDVMLYGNLAGAPYDHRADRLVALAVR